MWRNRLQSLPLEEAVPQDAIRFNEIALRL